MKKILSVILSTVLAGSAALSMASCGHKDHSTAVSTTGQTAVTQTAEMQIV